ncbi:MAG: methyltransferase domain-containing protein [Clostridia bacterium]|nr:methyltransferase domain-containing protein [Clostridia bacterium]
MFICPICKAKLNIQGKSYACENNHSFDVAKQGYVNLLPVNKKHSDNPGDSKDMVLSRRAFLESGYYDCFTDKLCEIINSLFKDRDKITVADCGCGEGYYDGKLESLNCDFEVFGFDISKEAVRYAAGKYKKYNYAVGSCFDMPLSGNSFDLALNIFAPMVESETARVLKKGGYMIYAVPGKSHLMGLKKVLYENTYENEEKHTEYDGFEFVGRHSVKSEITVNGEMGVNLFKMTPYYFKTELGAEEKIIKNSGFTTEIHFDFLIYRKK